MTKTEQKQFLENSHSKLMSILNLKGNDYAGDDVLLNFKQMHSMMSLLKIDMSKIEGTHMFYILLKIQRLCNLIFNDKTPNNESLNDNLEDLENYIKLMRCTLEEKRLNSITTLQDDLPF